MDPVLNKLSPGGRCLLILLMGLVFAALMLYILSKPRNLEPLPQSMIDGILCLYSSRPSSNQGL